MQVTDAMVEAASKRLWGPVGIEPGDRMREALREAIQAALDAMPKATGGLVPGPQDGDAPLIPLGRDSCFPGWIPLQAPITVAPGTTYTIDLHYDPEAAREDITKALRIRIRGTQAPPEFTKPHRVPVTEPRPLATASELHLYLGESRECIARMIVQRDGYDPPMPEPVRHDDGYEPLYDPHAVKAWYDALPQAANE